MAKPFHERVFDVVARIPRGRVASYKLVGTLAGSPNSARHVGRVMRLGKGLPWWRVIAQDGRVVIVNPQYRYEQILRLEEEGVEVVDGVVDYGKHAWRPRGLKPRAPPKKTKRPSARRKPSS